MKENIQAIIGQARNKFKDQFGNISFTGNDGRLITSAMILDFLTYEMDNMAHEILKDVTEVTIETVVSDDEIAMAANPDMFIQQKKSGLMEEFTDSMHRTGFIKEEERQSENGRHYIFTAQVFKQSEKRG